MADLRGGLRRAVRAAAKEAKEAALSVRYRAAFRSSAAEAIRHLPPGINHAVRSAIREIISNPASGEPLRGELEGLWKRRVRGYRVIYGMDREERRLDILAVGERRSIYEEVAELLRPRP